MISKKLIIFPLTALFTAMAAPYVAASVIAHKDSSSESTSNFRSAASISHRLKNICSGVILNQRWIITSASCIQRHLNVTELLISYGSIDRNAATRSNVAAEQIVLHPNFNSVSLENNVALIKTKKNINFSVHVEPAKFPTNNTIEDEKAYAIGWEVTNEKVSLELICSFGFGECL